MSGKGLRKGYKPSSSARAADSVNAAAGIGFGGFSGATPLAAAASAFRFGFPAASPESDVTNGGADAAREPAMSADLDGQIAQSLRHLSKKDTSTKLKALKALKSSCAAAPPATIALVLQPWAWHYKKLVMDPSRLVRAEAGGVMQSMVAAAGKQLASVVKMLMGPWWMAQFDPHTEGAAAARAAFKAAFVGPKQLDALMFCRSELLTYLHDNINSTPQLLGDARRDTPEELQERYERVVGASLMGLATLLELAGQAVKQAPEGKEQAYATHESELSSRISNTLHQPGFYKKFLASKSPAIRRAIYVALQKICTIKPELLLSESQTPDSQSQTPQSTTSNSQEAAVTNSSGSAPAVADTSSSSSSSGAAAAGGVSGGSEKDNGAQGKGGKAGAKAGGKKGGEGWGKAGEKGSGEAGSKGGHPLGDCAPLIIGAVGEQEPGNHGPMWELLLAFVKAHPDSWDACNLPKAIFPRLYSLLRHSCYGSAPTSFPAILPLLIHMPPHATSLDTPLPSQLLSSIWSGLEASATRPAKAAAAACFAECAAWLLGRGGEGAAGEEAARKLLQEVVVGSALPAVLHHTPNSDYALDTLTQLCTSLSRPSPSSTLSSPLSHPPAAPSKPYQTLDLLLEVIAEHLDAAVGTACAGGLVPGEVEGGPEGVPGTDGGGDQVLDRCRELLDRLGRQEGIKERVGGAVAHQLVPHLAAAVKSGASPAAAKLLTTIISTFSLPPSTIPSPPPFSSLPTSDTNPDSQPRAQPPAASHQLDLRSLAASMLPLESGTLEGHGATANVMLLLSCIHQSAEQDEAWSALVETCLGDLASSGGAPHDTAQVNRGIHLLQLLIAQQAKHLSTAVPPPSSWSTPAVDQAATTLASPQALASLAAAPQLLSTLLGANALSLSLLNPLAEERVIKHLVSLLGKVTSKSAGSDVKERCMEVRAAEGALRLLHPVISPAKLAGLWKGYGEEMVEVVGAVFQITWAEADAGKRGVGGREEPGESDGELGSEADSEGSEHGWDHASNHSADHGSDHNHDQDRHSDLDLETDEDEEEDAGVHGDGGSTSRAVNGQDQAASGQDVGRAAAALAEVAGDVWREGGLLVEVYEVLGWRWVMKVVQHCLGLLQTALHASASLNSLPPSAAAQWASHTRQLLTPLLSPPSTLTPPDHAAQLILTPLLDPTTLPWLQYAANSTEAGTTRTAAASSSTGSTAASSTAAGSTAAGAGSTCSTAGTSMSRYAACLVTSIGPELVINSYGLSTAGTLDNADADEQPGTAVGTAPVTLASTRPWLAVELLARLSTGQRELQSAAGTLVWHLVQRAANAGDDASSLQYQLVMAVLDQYWERACVEPDSTPHIKALATLLDALGAQSSDPPVLAFLTAFTSEYLSPPPGSLSPAAPEPPRAVLIELLPIVAPVFRQAPKSTQDTSGLPESSLSWVRASCSQEPVVGAPLPAHVDTLRIASSLFPVPAVLDASLLQALGNRISEREKAALRSLLKHQAVRQAAVAASKRAGELMEGERSGDEAVSGLVLAALVYCWRDLTGSEWHAVMQDTQAKLSAASRSMEEAVRQLGGALQDAAAQILGPDADHPDTATAVQMLRRLQRKGLLDKHPAGQALVEAVGKLREECDVAVGTTAAAARTLQSMLLLDPLLRQHSTPPSGWSGFLRGTGATPLALVAAAGCLQVAEACVPEAAGKLLRQWRDEAAGMWGAVSGAAVLAMQCGDASQSAASTLESAAAAGGTDGSGALLALIIAPRPQRQLQEAAWQLLLQPALLLGLTFAAAQEEAGEGEGEREGEGEKDVEGMLAAAGVRPELIPPLLDLTTPLPSLRCWTLLLSHLSLLSPTHPSAHSLLTQALHEAPSLLPSLLDSLSTLLPLTFSQPSRRKSLPTTPPPTTAAPTAATTARTSLYEAARNLGLSPGPRREALEKLAVLVYRGVLKELPASARIWYGDIRDRALVAAVEAYTAERESPGLIAAELFGIQAAGRSSGDKFSVRTASGAREVVAVMEVEDSAKLEMAIRLPTCFPLKAPEVDLRKQVGVAEAKIRKWLLSISAFLRNQNATLASAVSLWQRNVEVEFAGVEPCLICYSVISSTNGQLPRLECRTCHIRFHPACLYKWFKSSAKSQCPHCQSLW